MRKPSPELRAAQLRMRQLADGTVARQRQAAASTRRLKRELDALNRRADLDRRIRIGRQLVLSRDPAQREFDRLMSLQSTRGLTQQEYGEAEHWQAGLDAFDARWPDLEYEQRRKCRGAYLRSLRARAAGAAGGMTV